MQCFWCAFSLAIILIFNLVLRFVVHVFTLSLKTHWPAQIKDTLVWIATLLASLAIQIDCKLLISLDVKTLIHLCHYFHPGGLQASSLIWIRILVHLRGLLSVHVLTIDCDPTIMLAQKAISDIIWWARWNLHRYWSALQLITLLFHRHIGIILAFLLVIV